MKHLASFIVLLLLLGCLAVEPGSNSADPLTGPALDAEIERLMRRDQVKGLAVAVIEGGRVTHLGSYGFRNVARQLPLEVDTIMYGASLTKAAFAYMVLQLVDEGQLDLDRSVADYLPKPLPEYPGYEPLGADERWRELTPRIILSHRTGLANLRVLEPDRKLRLHFDPGAHYAYAGEGFWVLQLVLEQGLGLDVKREMQQRLFDRFSMPDTDMQWRESFAANLADGYAIDGSFEPHDERSNVSASGSMDTTIHDQARLWRAIVIGEGLSPERRKEFAQAQFPIRTKQKFPTIQMHATYDPGGEPIELSAGLGVEVWRRPDSAYFAKGGHNDWTANLVICREQDQTCLVMLANSVRAELLFPDLVERVLGETGYPWWWTYSSLHGDRRP